MDNELKLCSSSHALPRTPDPAAEEQIETLAHSQTKPRHADQGLEYTCRAWCTEAMEASWSLFPITLRLHLRALWKRGKLENKWKEK